MAEDALAKDFGDLRKKKSGQKKGVENGSSSGRTGPNNVKAKVDSGLRRRSNSPTQPSRVSVPQPQTTDPQTKTSQYQKKHTHSKAPVPLNMSNMPASALSERMEEWSKHLKVASSIVGTNRSRANVPPGTPPEQSQYTYEVLRSDEEVQQEQQHQQQDDGEEFHATSVPWHSSKKDAEIVKSHLFAQPLPRVPPGVNSE